MAGQALELQQAKAAIAQLELDKAQLEVQASQLLRTEAQHAQQAKVGAVKLAASRPSEQAEHALDVEHSSTGLIKAHRQTVIQVPA